LRTQQRQLPHVLPLADVPSLPACLACPGYRGKVCCLVPGSSVVTPLRPTLGSLRCAWCKKGAGTSRRPLVLRYEIPNFLTWQPSAVRRAVAVVVVVVVVVVVAVL